MPVCRGLGDLETVNRLPRGIQQTATRRGGALDLKHGAERARMPRGGLMCLRGGFIETLFGQKPPADIALGK